MKGQAITGATELTPAGTTFGPTATFTGYSFRHSRHVSSRHYSTSTCATCITAHTTAPPIANAVTCPTADVVTHATVDVAACSMTNATAHLTSNAAIPT